MILWRGTRGFGIDRIKIEAAAAAQTSTQQKHRQHHSSLIYQWIVHINPIQLKNDRDYYFIYF
ncbi:hypothetical protein M5Z62_07495 [Neisseria meningitidis]|nr:hypothetical protein [Neisseria meningitidis]